MSLEKDVIDARDAKALLDNPILKSAFEKVDEGLEKRLMGCDTTKSPETAADIARCKQLMGGLKREIQNIISNGDIAEFQLSELDKKKRLRFSRGH